MRGIDIYVSLIFFVKYDTAKALMGDATDRLWAF